MSGLNTRAMIDGLASHALSLGVFDKVNTHEPKAYPGHGLRAAIWSDRIEPYREGSGLASTSVVVTFYFRMYQNMMQEPQDEIDTHIIEAVDALMAKYSGDFDLAGAVRNVDLLGEAGTPLSSNAGYLNIDGKMCRTVDVIVPVIVNDAWVQAS